jgi:hypothetical protein
LLCKGIGIFDAATIMAGTVHGQFLDPTTLVGMKRGEIQASIQADNMPDDLLHLSPVYGYHINSDTEHHLVVREPKLFRTAKTNQCNLRTTWIKTREGWKQIERAHDWTKDAHPQPFKHWVERAVFVSSQQVLPSNCDRNTSTIEHAMACVMICDSCSSFDDFESLDIVPPDLGAVAPSIFGPYLSGAVLTVPNMAAQGSGSSGSGASSSMPTPMPIPGGPAAQPAAKKSMPMKALPAGVRFERIPE